jgi:hypothetical protein
MSHISLQHRSSVRSYQEYKSHSMQLNPSFLTMQHLNMIEHPVQINNRLHKDRLIRRDHILHL